MEKRLTWRVGWLDAPAGVPEEWVPAAVPGAVQLDWARAKGWEPYYIGTNCRDYTWMEDKYWLYEAELDFTLRGEERAALVFEGIDYRYCVTVDGEVLLNDEGMFAPHRLDVTRFAGAAHTLRVLLWPIPKADDSGTRDQARLSAKPAVSYGWDFHPRLVPTGIWQAAYLDIGPAYGIEAMDVSYVLTDDLSRAEIDVTLNLSLPGRTRVRILREGETVAETETDSVCCTAQAVLTLQDPALWYPAGYGDQPLYTVTAETLDPAGKVTETRMRRLGLRRSRLVMNAGAWSEPSGMPRSRSDVPITLEINGRRLFGRGSNWVAPQIFPSEISREQLNDQLTLAKDANMNLLRVWGGAIVNTEDFFELCDEKGIMVWQEFPLACNEYVDDPHYLAVLEQEAVAVVRRIRTHPSLVIWCGGNELFNSWSGMTDQHHALRLLDSICYREDRQTPFIMTSPLTGMAHGHYVNYDPQDGIETIERVTKAHFTAYTEFGAPAVAPADYIRGFMSEEDFRDFRPENEVWREHHAFGVWREDSWSHPDEIRYFFGGWENSEDLCEKAGFIQSMCVRSNFEEMRRQWPHCSMAMNWCFNEPWPAAANNSLVAWPAVPKDAYYAVQAALRPRLASLRITHHLWRGGTQFEAGVFLINDTLEPLEPGTVQVFYRLDGCAEQLWGTLSFEELAAQTVHGCGTMTFALPAAYEGKIHVRLAVADYPEMDSAYTYLCRSGVRAPRRKMLND